MWDRGDRVNLAGIKTSVNQANVNKETAAFLIDKVEDFLKAKPDDRIKITDFVVSLLQFYAKNFKNAEDLLWCKFFNEQKY